MKVESRLFIFKLWPAFLLFVGLPLLSYIIWLIIPAKQIEVLILDKTVPDVSYREHAGLFWTLDHLKYKKLSGEYYSKDQDYMGFFPNGKADFGTSKDLSGKSEQQIRELASQNDLIYLTDSYGVYEGDFDKTNPEGLSKKVYGGLDFADIQLIRMAKEEGKVMVAEFNSIASPTPKPIRTEFENLMGLKWTGWIGRYFDELDTTLNSDIPRWMISQYHIQHDEWNLSGPGLIFIKESGEIEAFLFKTDYQNKVPLIRTQKVNKHGFSLPEVVPYPDWFDVMMIERDYQVISYYDINPTSEGLQKLRDMGLPRFFPAAVVRHLEKGSQYYFSGDYSDLHGDLGASRYYGVPVLWRGFYVASDYPERQSFFWNYYYPLISQILEETLNGAN